MRERLGGEWERFAEIYAKPPWYGLRVNQLKIMPEAVKNLLPFPLTPVRWCPEGYIYPSGERPAKHPAYRAGLYYIQEPSAMLPAELLNPRPGDRVLDLCAAPGGKSVQLAGKLNGRGMLVSNDVSATRSRALVKNLELAGVTNVVVLNEQPHRLAERFAGFFDKILVDAPCSGEGMFRRDFDSAKSWAANKPEACSALQKEILHHAAAMLKPGGRLVYSTCTFSETEDEDVVGEFLLTHKDFCLLPVDFEGLGISPTQVTGAARTLNGSYDMPTTGMDCGNQTYEIHGSSRYVSPTGISCAARIWPHKADGEGHFAALLIKAGSQGETGCDEDCLGLNDAECFQPDNQVLKLTAGLEQDNQTLNLTAGLKPERVSDEFKNKRSRNLRVASNDISSPPEVFRNFCYEQLTAEASAFLLDCRFTVSGVSLYRVPQGLPDLRGLRLARSGWYMGDITSGRFTPSQALAMGLKLGDAKAAADLPEGETTRYLRGESITPKENMTGVQMPLEGKPWVLVGSMGYPLGWARWVGGRLKNYLPAGWVDA
jgi:16S rRNA C967 or C1407 C5-methylase (RsmB/RsmF family)/NOL1/NOP2/fmu family ribosome biogenesis protein